MIENEVYCFRFYWQFFHVAHAVFHNCQAVARYQIILSLFSTVDEGNA